MKLTSNNKLGTKILTLTLIVLLTSLIFTTMLTTTAFAEPSGVSITNNRTETGQTGAAGSSTTAGGTFTTMVLNLTQQTPRWKAYVGNVTGSFTLADNAGSTIYDWGETTSIAGEVYVSRNNNPSWTDIRCAQAGTITTEETFLNMSPSSIDSIENTYNESVHKEFFVGTKKINESICPAIATYINSAPQASGVNADFQEIMLDDTSNIIYAAMLDQATLGYDNSNYDFQLIVPEDEYASTPTTYYFWVELS